MTPLEQRPPVSWLVWLYDRAVDLVERVIQALEKLWVLIATPLRPIAEPVERLLARLFARSIRRRALRHARQLDELADKMSGAGLTRQSAQIRELADRWRCRARYPRHRAPV